MISAASFSDWRPRLDQPIASSLLLSLSLHLLLLVLVQPAPGGGERGTLVINARLAMPAADIPEAVPQAPAEPVPEAAAETAAPPVVPPEKTAQPLLTSSVPSPAPPLPVPPAPLPVATPAKAAAPATAPQATAASAPATTPRNGAGAGASAPFSVGIDTTWYLARQVDVHARSLGAVVPDYPDEARRRNQEGSLKLMVKIDDLGRVRDVEVVEADLPGVFDEAALEAFRNARFQPAMKDGRPVRYQAYIRVVFRLRD